MERHASGGAVATSGAAAGVLTRGPVWTALPYDVFHGSSLDLSWFVAYVGQPGFMRLPDGQAAAVYFVSPCDRTLAFRVRRLFPPTLRSVYSVTFVDTVGARHLQVALSNSLLKVCPQLERREQHYRDAVMRLLTRETDAGSLDMVIDDPITGMPDRIVTFEHDGKLLGLREAEVDIAVAQRRNRSVATSRRERLPLTHIRLSSGHLILTRQSWLSLTPGRKRYYGKMGKCMPRCCDGSKS